MSMPWDNWSQTWTDFLDFLKSGQWGADPNTPEGQAAIRKSNQNFMNWLQGQGQPGAPVGTPTSGLSGAAPPTVSLQSLWQAQLAIQSQLATSGAAAAAGYYTPDGVWISDNSPQDAYYRMVDAIWTKIYGQHPPFSMVQTFHDLGVENTSQLDTIMKQMPSHITNPDGSKMPIGQYDVIKGTAENFSDKYFGRPIPDSLIQDWVKKGITDPESIELWFLNHPAKDIPKDVYGKIFDAAADQVQKTWNDLPHPDTVNAIHQSLLS